MRATRNILLGALVSAACQSGLAVAAAGDVPELVTSAPYAKQALPVADPPHVADVWKGGGPDPSKQAAPKSNVHPLDVHPVTEIPPLVAAPVEPKPVVAKKPVVKPKPKAILPPAKVEAVPATPKPAPIAAAPKEKILTEPNLALKLPGVGELPGKVDVFKPTVIDVGGDRNVIVGISGTYSNRIVTPFEDPKWNVSGDDSLHVEKIGQSLIVTVKNLDHQAPSVMFITGQSKSDPMAMLTLVPKNLPGQTATLRFEDKQRSVAPAEKRPKTDEYVANVVYMMRSLALGTAPEGFAPSALPVAVGTAPGMLIRPKKRFSGPTSDIYQYDIEATKDGELSEQMFATDRSILAVSFFPKAALVKGEHTQVFVLAERRDQEGEGQ